MLVSVEHSSVRPPINLPVYCFDPNMDRQFPSARPKFSTTSPETLFYYTASVLLYKSQCVERYLASTFPVTFGLAEPVLMFNYFSDFITVLKSTSIPLAVIHDILSRIYMPDVIVLIDDGAIDQYTYNIIDNVFTSLNVICCTPASYHYTIEELISCTRIQSGSLSPQTIPIALEI